ncbi:terminase large subunit [Streptomyces phage Aaronocolus]|uniref:Terminase large subunit n=6 Tax=Likavirus TaxID=1982880 RepID=A0A411CVB2_9CAUD|nr:terminase large subunit [Streptomyces phage Caliburn]YP_009616431.1 terminase large subunit [Streptomyces phage Aaronocolus]YP_009616506.1 terminase large subunit [Streptomyces phage Hydra]QAY17282.1 terminase large subunit [Streptomyces phage Indigo]QAY17824.1 terminase large subunit [Streptomyces phage Nerdos]QGJ91523.1 terminase large subunit [Streptomyces phage Phettuccine]URQ04921.1 terminase large subunit [Streptomyces phage Legacy]AKY03316.1 terminase large subunit [Streptomyces ph
MTPQAGLTLEEIEALEPTYIGPTWKKDAFGQWVLPKHTLGWQIAGWCAQWLKAEDGGPWKFTKEQLRFVLHWYAVDETGRFINRKGVLQRLKGWGKDPLLAVLCLVELVGPSRFSHWDENGDPVGEPHPQAWVQVTAVNQSQTTNTMSLIPSLMSDAFKAHFDIKDGAVLIRANGGKQRLEAVTSSYRALEGKRTTFTLLNETHHWVSGNNGHKMYETIDGNATKKDSRYLAITNAYLPGEDSVAERMRESFEKILEGRALDVGFMYDSLEAHPKTPLSPEALKVVIPKIRGDAVWLRVESIIQSVLDTTIAPSRSRRMWLNQIVAEEDALYGPAEWDVLGNEKLILQPGDEIVLGFDGGKTHDATALVAIRVRDMAAFLLGLWEKPDGPQGDNWEVPRWEVDSEVHSAFKQFKVQAFYADVALWESYISEWSETYGDSLVVKSPVGRDAIGFDMRSSLKLVTMAHERLMRSIFDGKLAHDGDRSLRRHALNARRRTNNYGVSFGKESRESPRKIDAYAALMLAHEALYDLRARGKKQKVRTGRGYFL